MRRLILMRHAKSDWNHPGTEDFTRPLNKRGRNSARALGHWLRSENFLPDQVLCSSAERTRETLTHLDFPPGTNIRFSRELYLADVSEMLSALRQAMGHTVLMIGHNPGICELAHRLVIAPSEHPGFENYPTGATLVCDFDGPDWNETGWHEGQPEAFIVPRELL